MPCFEYDIWICTHLSFGTHLDPDVMFEVVLEALQMQLQHRGEVTKQVANLGVLHSTANTSCRHHRKVLVDSSCMPCMPASWCTRAVTYLQAMALGIVLVLAVQPLLRCQAVE
jgi:hypothetical protein